MVMQDLTMNDGLLGTGGALLAENWPA